MTYFKNSLRNKLVLFLLAAIVLPISTSIFVTYYYTKENVTKTYIDNNTTLLFQGGANLLNYMNRINQASLLIYQDSRNERSLYRILEKDEIQFADQQDLYVNFQYMVNSLAEIKQVFIYLDNPKLSYRFAYNLPRYTSGQSFKPVFEESHDIQIESTHLSHNYGVAKFPFEMAEDVITIHRKILNQPADNILGTLSIDIKLNMIHEISDMLYTSGEEELYLFNADGSIIYSSEDAPTSEYPWLSPILNQDRQSGHLEYKSESFAGIHLYQKIKTPLADLTLIKRVPYEYLTKNAKQLTMINSLIVLSFLIIAAIGTIYVSFHFTSPVKQLLRYIIKIESGQMDADLDTTRTDEIGILSRRFHQLIQRLNQLINKEYRLELANKTNQLKALQAQVHPHFMNNALQSIGTLALQNNQKKIYSLIAALGKMMRYQMNTNEVLVPLSREIDYVNAYLGLQAQRFDEKLTFFIEAEDEAKEIEVPKMILQPLVENCFKHGFIKQNNVGEVRITARLIKPDLLSISVEDNGSGLDDKQLEALQFQLDHLYSEGAGSGENRIGLFNVLSRLQLYFNQHTSITLTARQPQGLKVTLLIPVAKGDISQHESIDR